MFMYINSDEIKVLTNLYYIYNSRSWINIKVYLHVKEELLTVTNIICIYT